VSRSSAQGGTRFDKRKINLSTYFLNTAKVILGLLYTQQARYLYDHIHYCVTALHKGTEPQD